MTTPPEPQPAQPTGTPHHVGGHRPPPHPRFVQWLIFGAALMPFFVTFLYMTFKPAPKMLKRNFPPAETAPESPAKDAAAAPGAGSEQ